MHLSTYTRPSLGWVQRSGSGARSTLKELRTEFFRVSIMSDSQYLALTNSLISVSGIYKGKQANHP